MYSQLLHTLIPTYVCTYVFFLGKKDICCSNWSFLLTLNVGKTILNFIIYTHFIINAILYEYIGWGRICAAILLLWVCATATFWCSLRSCAKFCSNFYICLIWFRNMLTCVSWFRYVLFNLKTSWFVVVFVNELILFLKLRILKTRVFFFCLYFLLSYDNVWYNIYRLLLFYFFFFCACALSLQEESLLD